MEVYSSFWTVLMFTFNVLIAVVGFGLIARSQQQVLIELKQQAEHQDLVWQKLFAKTENTERLSQEILTRLANEKQPH